MAFKDVLKQLRYNAGYSQRQLAELLYISTTAYQNWELGKSLPAPNKIQTLAEALKVDPQVLTSAIVQAPSNVRVMLPRSGRTVPVPLLSREVTACCGAGIPTYSEIQNEPEKTFTYTISDLGGRYDQMRPPVAIYADGACLERSRIQDGDILVINPALEPRHLQICVVCWRGVLSAKRVQLNQDGSVDLRSDYDTYHIDAEEAADPDRFNIWGPVVEVRHGLL